VIQKLSDHNEGFETAYIVLYQNLGFSVVFVCVFVTILFNIYIYILYCILLSLFHGHPNEAEGPLVVREPHFGNLYITGACTVNRVVHASSVATVCVCQSRELYQ
jgi:hypothetical protein